MEATGKIDFKRFDEIIPRCAEKKSVLMVCEKHGSYKADIEVFTNGMRLESKCPICEMEQHDKENAERRAREEKRLMAETNIEPEFVKKTFADYKPNTESQKKALEAVKKMVFERRGKVVLLGSNGVGKTMLASIAAKELRGKIYSMYEISTMIRQSYTVKAEKTELEIVRELASVPFLAIDELGRTKNSESEQNWLSYILDKRHARNLPFMLMSNGHFKKFCPGGGCQRCFENFIDNDILSRLRQDSVFVAVDAPDERRAGR